MLDGDPPRDLVVEVHASDARLSDLLRATGATDGDVPGPAWWVDGIRVDVDTPVGDLALADGAILSPGPTRPALRHAVPGTTCPRAIGAAVTVVAGPGAARRRDLPSGRTMEVGRDPSAGLVLGSATVSSRHLRLRFDDDSGDRARVEVEDHGSRNGTWVEGQALAPHEPTSLALPVTVRVGACVLRIESAPACDRPMGRPDRVEDGRWAFNRPPRPALPAPVDEVEVPEPPAAAGRAQALRWAAILAPLALGGVMVGMGRDPRFALFMLLSPVVAVATWWSARRRARKDRRASGASWADALATFDRDLERARVARLARDEEVLPHLGEVVRRATEPSTRLWERRPDHDDALTVRVGSADRQVTPPLRRRRAGQDGPHPDGPDVRERQAEVAAHVADHAHLPAAPLDLDLGRTPVIGLVGDPSMARGLARAMLVQLATHHGPADLQVAVLTGPGGAAAWAWARWLPHTEGDDRRLVARDLTTARSVVAALASRHAPADPGQRRQPRPVTALVVDDVALVAAPEAPARDLLRPGHGTTIVLVRADHPDLLPSACDVVVSCRGDGTGDVVEPRAGTRQAVLLAPLDRATARRAALALAHLVDPEQSRPESVLPPLVRLTELLEDDVDQGSDPTDGGRRLATPLGRDRGGTARVDLVADGPHALVGGTTGSGKSELLRSLVTGLAVRHSSDQVVFVLVDYKGGAAFRECADLPHTVGLVTDLDDHLGARALASLDAELRHREAVLAAAGCRDLPTHVEAGSPGGPMPRLVVVIDEFATLAAELPDFLTALVGIAQRGRSLGMHLVLATQRPRGSVDANVRANTNLRIALRVQDATDSQDLLDAAVAAELPRHLPGRAWIRRGHGDLALVQTALASAPRLGPGSPVVAAAFEFAPTSPVAGPSTADHGETDLSRLVAGARSRHEASGIEPPRRPWLPMLATDLSLLDLPACPSQEDAAVSTSHLRPRDGVPDGAVPIGLVDRPTEQVQRVSWWDLDTTTLAATGPVGAGATTTLETVAVAAARRWSPDDLHLYVVDAGGGGLARLADLPHTGAALGIESVDEHAQLLSWLAGEVRDRQSLRRGDRVGLPRLLLVLDNLTGFLDVHDDRASRTVSEDLATVLGEGAGMGVATVVATERLAGTSPALRGALNRVLVFGRPPERELSLAGLRDRDLPTPTPGRAVDATTADVVQVARLPDDVDPLDLAVPVDGTGPARPPRSIRGLPDRVEITSLPAPRGPHPVDLPVGIGRTGTPSRLVVGPGDHVVVSGPARSGRTTVLQVLSSQLRRAVPDAIQVAVCDRERSALHGWPSLDAAGAVVDLGELLRAGMARSVPWFVFVDDVRWSADDALFADLVTARPDLHVVLAGRPDEVRGGFGSWQRTARAGRTGILLQPDLAVDGDLLGASLPRHLRTALGPGRGFVVDAGTPELAQLANVPTDPAPGSLVRAQPDPS